MANPRLPLDVELAWGTPPPEKGEEFRPQVGFVRLLAALWLDFGFATGCVLLLLAAVSLSWQVSLTLPQVLIVAGVGSVAVAGTVEFAFLWCFSATLGMRLLHLSLDKPMPPRTAWILWLAVLFALPTAGLPLAVGRSPSRWLERLAEGRLKVVRTPFAA
ncbi:MAG: hypothetical protein NZ869_00875 [Thermoanaerobaculum sp.]|nr:hypothetical protein [Thermoanaerobaculum sp.]MDW7966859.1 hypothetical protein [Thermoanaerobaculum sp.]